MNLCARCGRPIEGEAQKVAADSATGAAEVVVHRDYCKSAPRQTYPSRSGR